MHVPAFLLPGAPVWFPDPRAADEDGVVALGADLSPTRLLHAYDRGIFPWFEGELPPIWWSPDPRAVITADTLHVSRRLERRLRQGLFRFTWDFAFEEVMTACGAMRPEGTWITDEMLAAYVRLFDLGAAHSLEVWVGDEIVGGTYGVHRGGLFAAESMFHRVTDASKAALVALVRTLARHDVDLIDVQMTTPHLASIGAVEVPRARYLAALAGRVGREVDLTDVAPDWRAD